VLRPPIELMRAAGVPGLPLPRMCRGGCAYEVKWDGWRAAAFIGAGTVLLQSRGHKALAQYFPDLIHHLADIPAGTVLDGELISFDSQAGRTSFSALQRRVTAGRGLAREAKARPATFVAFDLLYDADGGDLRDLPLVQRRARLETRLAGAPTAVQVCPQTTDYDEAVLWLDAHARLGGEGLVIKDLAGRYRRTGWWKYKLKVTVEAIIGGLVGTMRAPTALLLGRRDERGRLRYVGRTSPLTAPQRQEITAAATPVGPEGRHPWPRPLPAGWSGQFEHGEPIDYQPVEPHLVAEVIADQAYEAGRWRHSVRHLRLRTDLSPDEVERWRISLPR
jgi:ATP-dependent DNA ligase